jgi:cytochrome o ubiquinol oxidase subunit 1
MFGRLTWDAIPFNEPIPLITSAVVILGVLAVLGIITKEGWWPYLWKEWLTSVDHKRIGIMYVFLGLIMLLRGFADAIMMRSQQALAVGALRDICRPTITTRSSRRTARS